MSRPIWKGHITFGLVNIPVVLYSAEKKFDIQFKLIDRRDNARIHYIRVNEQTGEEVPWNDIAKGYEYEENNFLVLKDQDFKTIAGENSKAITIESFVNQASIEFLEFDRPYYLVPDKHGNKGYVILREILNNTHKVGVAKVMIHTREYLAVLFPHKNALILNLLHYHEEIRQPDEFDLPTKPIKDYKISTKEMDIAKELVNLMSSKWDPDAYHDEFKEAIRKWVSEEINNTPHPKKAKSLTRKSNVTDFMSLLKKSLKNKKQRKPPRVSHKKKHAHVK